VGSASARDSSVEIRDLEAFAARRWRWREEEEEEVVVEEDFSMRVTKLLWRARRAAFLGFLVEAGMRLLVVVVVVGAREALARIEERALGISVRSRLGRREGRGTIVVGEVRICGGGWRFLEVECD